MTTVGIIANPASGKDIRRLVAHGRFIPNHEKVNILRRILAGLAAVGVEQVVVMPEPAMLVKAASGSARCNLEIQFLNMPVYGEARDSTKAAELMSEMGVGCLVVLGGDGTNRAVAKGSKGIPLVPVSTGTNNTFPKMVEGTVAGMAAGLVAKGLVDIHMTTVRRNRLEIYQNGTLRDIALVDLAVAHQRFVGARALWDMDSVHELFLAQAEPGSIGLSAIGSQLRPTAPGEDVGIHIRLGPGGMTVRAPVAPGMIVPVPIKRWHLLMIGARVRIDLRPCTLALDGERTFSLHSGEVVCVEFTSCGPTVVQIAATLREAALHGIFVENSAAADLDSPA